MPTRRLTDTDINAAIERRLNTLRQIPARIEAEQLIAKKFADAGRPLRPDHILEDLQEHETFRAASVETEINPFSPQFRIAFWTGAEIAGVLVAAYLVFA